jgi:protease PrsW
MLAVISAGIAPGLAMMSYLYLKDRYDSEPFSMVLRVFIFGAMLVFPIMFIQYVLQVEGIFVADVLKAFIATSLLEEFFKWFVLFYIVYQHVEFDEPYDGIIYGASVSLGFATVENILYLFANGVEFAFARALLPVSSHALFGVIMGYYMGKGKFSNRNKISFVIISLLLPFVLHGIYDFILLTQERWLFYILPFMVFLWWFGIRKLKVASM